MATASGRVRGKVKWFNAEKGYGFIVRDDGGKDCFVHRSALNGDGFKKVDEGDVVEFTIEDGPKGPAAKDVNVISRAVYNEK